MSAAGQSGGIQGRVLDGITGSPVAEARVEARDGWGEVAGRAATDAAGSFTLDGLLPARYEVRITRLGYAAQTVEGVEVRAGAAAPLEVALAPGGLVGSPLVVTASRRPERAADAPASVTVVDREEVLRRVVLAPADHVRDVAGVDVASHGLTQQTVVVRGFGNLSSGAVRLLTDFRDGTVPSLRINIPHFLPQAGEDLDRVEVVRGPASALYGPNASGGVVHLLTRSPFEAPGTTVSLAGGERGVLQGTVRHAGRAGPRFGYRVSAQGLRGDDWPGSDPAEADERIQRILEGADPDTLLVGVRDPRVERMATDASVEWRPGPGTRVTAAAGANLARSNVELTPVGAAQARNWRYAYGQVRVNRGPLFAQAYLNTSDAGDSYLVRQGTRLVDRSWVLGGQAQYSADLARGTHVTLGMDLQHTEPRTAGTVNGRNEDDDHIREAGLYLHGEHPLGSRLSGVAAVRTDWHNRMDAVASPRAALLYRPSPGHTLRLSFNRAFSTPNASQLFLDLPAARFLDYGVRLVGVPSTGFSFPRTCGGLCMRSPLNDPAQGGAQAYLPLDGTLVWDALVRGLQGQGLDLTAVPRPTAAQVGTVLGGLDPECGRGDPGCSPFLPVDDVSDIPPLRPTTTTTLEAGWQGRLAGASSLAVDVYHSWIRDFIGPERVETPNAFLNRADLVEHLGRHLPEDQASNVAGLLAGIPVGVVTPSEARDPTDVLLSFRNFGTVRVWGVDLAATAHLGENLAATATYSWVSRDLFPSPAGWPEVPLNAPRVKGAVALAFVRPQGPVSGELRGRSVRGFPGRSGVYSGRVASYSVVDAAVGTRLPRAPRVDVTLTVQNLLDHRHRQFVGAPELGRLALLRTRIHL